MKKVIISLAVLVCLGMKLIYEDFFTAQPNDDQKTSGDQLPAASPADTKKAFVNRYTVPVQS